MRIKDPLSEPEEPFNLIPLTDMVFNLLIFFMAATSFTQIEKEMAVQLPKTAPFQTMSAPPKQLVINIKADGSTVVAGKTYERTGPRLLTFGDAADEISKASGREVRYVPIPPEQYASVLARTSSRPGR